VPRSHAPLTESRTLYHEYNSWAQQVLFDRPAVSNATTLANRLLDRYSVHGRRGLRSLGDLMYRLTSGGPHGIAAHMLAALVHIRTPTQHRR
jgi:hypothetical protein